MALYAFDGTWNKDKKGTEGDTNVVWFRDAYTGETFYEEGVGTRFGRFGSIAGGIAGAGGRSRVRRQMERLKRQLEKGDTTIDIVGFSRGAALALHFSNQVSFYAQEQEIDLPIRFLGLWDTVPSFGVPGNTVDIGWDLDCPDNVAKCFHAMALDERRKTFPLRRPGVRLQDARAEGRLFEVWFRGVHSDVGGGNKKPQLSSIALNWMFANARRVGVSFDASAVVRNRKRMNSSADISTHWYDLIKDPDRPVSWTDRVHQSVRYRRSTWRRRHNHPPDGLWVVDDVGRKVRRFKRPANA